MENGNGNMKRLILVPALSIVLMASTTGPTRPIKFYAGNPITQTGGLLETIKLVLSCIHF